MIRADDARATIPASDAYQESSDEDKIIDSGDGAGGPRGDDRRLCRQGRGGDRDRGHGLAGEPEGPHRGSRGAAGGQGSRLQLLRDGKRLADRQAGVRFERRLHGPDREGRQLHRGSDGQAIQGAQRRQADSRGPARGGGQGRERPRRRAAGDTSGHQSGSPLARVSHARGEALSQVLLQVPRHDRQRRRPRVSFGHGTMRTARPTLTSSGSSPTGAPTCRPGA